MEKDKTKNLVNNVQNACEKIYFSLVGLFNKLISYVHFLDPKDNTKQRVVSSIILVPLAVYAIFFSKSVFIFIAIALAILMTIEWLDIVKTSKDISHAISTDISKSIIWCIIFVYKNCF